MNPLLQIINLYTISKRLLCKEYHSIWETSKYDDSIFCNTFKFYVNYRPFNYMLKEYNTYLWNIYRFDKNIIEHVQRLPKNYISIPLI